MVTEVRIDLDPDLREVASSFASAVATGAAREIACYGARGDGKTFAGAWGTILHAVEHAERGFPLPVPWMCVTDTHRSHRLKTIRSLLRPEWRGRWVLRDDEHLAVFLDGGIEWVALDLFGVEDAGAMNRLRMETAGVWFEEPAPVLAESSGISDLAWSVALSSQRVPTHARVAMITSNYPGPEHWSWRRFVSHPAPGTLCFRIPSGERRSPELTAELERAYAEQPELLRRLVRGEPAHIVLGASVTPNYDGVRHLAHAAIRPDPEEPLVLAWDGGLTPTTTVGQRPKGGKIRVYAGLYSERAGIKQHDESLVLPWLARYAPWALRDADFLRHVVDPSMQTPDETDIDRSPARMIAHLLGGAVSEGATDWAARVEPLHNALDPSRNLFEISPVPETEALRLALGGRWHFPKDLVTGQIRRDLPVKDHPWSDLGDTACYLVGFLAPSRAPFDPRKARQTHATTEFNVLDYGRRRPSPERAASMLS